MENEIDLIFTSFGHSLCCYGHHHPVRCTFNSFTDALSLFLLPKIFARRHLAFQRTTVFDEVATNHFYG